jgi:thiamine-monophosphate kinase
MKVTDLGEHALLARLLARLPRPTADVLLGPGDDAAIVARVRNEQLVVTTDSLVEEVHFSRTTFSPTDIGHKAMAANLSDLAAMGATPRWALVSLVLPGSLPVADVEQIMDGAGALAAAHGVSVIGGNIARTAGPLVVDMTLGGDVHPRKVLMRSGAKAGDAIYVSGTIGGAAAGLEMLSGGSAEIRREAEPNSAGRPTTRAPGVCIARQRRPEPRVRLGIALARGRAARAAMDLSDGLADAVRQVAAASGCGARLEAAALPIEPDAATWWTSRGVDPIRAAIAGGEEYELLFAVAPRSEGRLRSVRRHVSEPALTKIGVFTKDAGQLLVDRDGSEESLPQGFEHFAHANR